MPYLKDFEHDIFISYAHVDNIPDREGEKGWVEEFEAQLSVRLLKRFGEPVAIWRDRKLQRAEVFDQVIEQAVRGSAIMISLISSRYLKSDYCQQEIAWFKEQREAGRGLVVDGMLRIFPVLLYNIPPGDWPETCHGTSAFNFHDAESDDFGEPLDVASEGFQQGLRQLVGEIYGGLTRLEGMPAAGSAGEEKAAGEAPVGPGESKFRVFLSHPADDLGPIRRQLASALEREGIELAGEAPPPYAEDEHNQAVTEAICGADLSVHLLGGSAGEPLDELDTARTYPIEQAKLGLQHACSQLILIPEEVDPSWIEPPAYAQFLNGLGEKQREVVQLEVVKTGRHRMMGEILAKRRQLEEAARRQAEPAAAGPGTAFIDLHSRDVVHATSLVGYLAERRIAPVMIPAADLSPTAGMSLFEENLKKAGLFIVVFGTVNRDWVEHRLQEAFKIILSHQLDIRIGVYVAPPEKPQEVVKFPPLFAVALNMSRFDPETLDSLLQAVPSGS